MDTTAQPGDLVGRVRATLLVLEAMPLVRRVVGELLQGRDAARMRLGLHLVVLGLHLLDDRQDAAGPR
eukprot:9442102-Alexandrium_andersonii.AAC.1